MKVILVNGSPHEKGCTYTALTEVQKTLEKNSIETEMFWIGNKAISGCLGCGHCLETNRCIIQDSVNDFLEKVEATDGFIFGTPVHFASGSGMITSFMDRVFYADLNGKGGRFRLKPAAAVISARRAGTTATWDQMNKYFGLMQMPIVTSRYWNMVHGATPDEVKQDKEGMQVMQVLGNNMAFFINCKNVAMKMGINMPEEPEFVFTNFIR